MSDAEITEAKITDAETKKTCRPAFSERAKGPALAALIVGAALAGGLTAHIVDTLDAPVSKSDDASNLADVTLQRDLAIAYANHETYFESNKTTYGIASWGKDLTGCLFSAVKANGYDLNGIPNSYAAPTFEDAMIAVDCPKP